MIGRLTIVFVLLFPSVAAAQQQPLSDIIRLTIKGVEERFLALDEARRLKKLAEEGGFQDTSREFGRLARDLAAYRYAPSSADWAHEAVEVGVPELEAAVESMIRFLAGDRKLRSSTRFKGESFAMQLAALSAVSIRIESLLDELAVSHTVGVSTLERLIQDLVTVRGLCAGLRKD